LPNKFVIFTSRGILKVIKQYAKNRCCIVTSWSQKQHLEQPYQVRLIRLSFVRITFLWNHLLSKLLFFILEPPPQDLVDLWVYKWYSI
jgi:hypothetical protein